MRRRAFLGALAAGTAGTTLPGFGAGASATTADPPRIDPAFVVNAPGTEEILPGADGRYVYGAAGDRLLVVDFDTLDEPSVVAEVEPTLDSDAMGGVGDLVRDGDRVAVVGPTGLADGDPPSGAAVFDVSTPTSPEQVVELQTDHSIHNAAFGDGVLYITANLREHSPMVAYDLAGDEPTEVSTWSVVDANDDWAAVPSTLHQTHDVTVRDGYAYVSNWDAGTWLVDVSDPANPSAVSQVGGVDPEAYESLSRDEAFARLRTVPGNAHNIALSDDGSLLAVGRESFGDGSGDDYSGPGGIELYDIGDKSSPERTSALRPPVVTNGDGEKSVSTAHNCHFRGDRLYAAWYESGVRVYDASDPTAPETLGAWASPRTTSFWTAVPLDEGFVASSYYDPSAPESARRDGENASIYAFPEPDASDAVAATTYEVNATGVPEQVPLFDFSRVETTTTTTDTAANTTAATTTEATTEVTPADPPPTTTESTDESSGGSTPGFGVGAAVAGTALAALHRLRDD
ncbi:LVIVD repeat-containing protein [Halobacterium litoreum]|uniref:LVIVD repeat-containing protein n=1 Tax=Halobacterium litoreum TaxID=2039234 RepID=A0ABD5NHZ1_9EURY|nr:hypothetical protein [Halobacterium litoreum]UHH12340.1 hypothetical protein LT972_09235 [Halobacterium litoreum]